MKKSLTIGTLVSLGIVAIMLIVSLFGFSFFEGVKLNLLITFACLTVGGYFSISSYNVLQKNKILGYIGLVFIWFAVILVLLSSWVNFGKLMANVTFTIAFVSVIFNFITSNNLKLGKNYLAVQVVCNIVICVFVLICLLMIYGVMKIGTLFWLMLILSVVSFIVVSVLASKFQGDRVDDNYVKIAKAEYEDLLAKSRMLEEMLNSKSE